MYAIATPENLNKAAMHLAEHDLVLKPVIAEHGVADIEPHKNYYQELVESIIGQQLSVKAAAAIRKRFRELFGSDFPSPEDILSKNFDTLRATGLSNAKTRYIQDLALHVIEGKLEFETLDSLSNEEVAAELTAVKGIGEWTAHMFMMFCMGRLDILPVGDLGIKNGVKKLYNLKEVPDADKIREMSVKGSWHPYESVASWYIWQSLDNTPKSL